MITMATHAIQKKQTRAYQFLTVSDGLEHMSHYAVSIISALHIFPEFCVHCDKMILKMLLNYKTPFISSRCSININKVGENIINTCGCAFCHVALLISFYFTWLIGLFSGLKIAGFLRKTMDL